MGEIVLLEESDRKTASLKMARITELHRGKDGEVRSATIELAIRIQVKRPMNLLQVLETREKNLSAPSVDDVDVRKSTEGK